MTSKSEVDIKRDSAQRLLGSPHLAAIKIVLVIILDQLEGGGETRRPTPQRKGWRRKQLGGHTLPTCPLAGPLTTLGFPLSGRRAQRRKHALCLFCFTECFPLLKKPVRVKQQALFSWLISPLGRGKRECKPCLDHQQHASSGGGSAV